MVETNEIRTCAIWHEGKWRYINFNDLREGDRFRLFEPSGDRVEQRGTEEWVADGKPYIDEKTRQLVIDVKEPGGQES